MMADCSYVGDPPPKPDNIPDYRHFLFNWYGCDGCAAHEICNIVEYFAPYKPKKTIWHK